MSETRTVVTSESLMQQLTGNAPAEEAPKPETTGEPETPEAEKPEDTPQEQPAKKKKPLVEELVRTRHERNEAKTEAEQLRAELAELRQQMQVAQTQAAPKDLDPKPVRSQFVSDEDYQEALTDWKVDQKLAERQQQEQQARLEAAQQALADNWQKRLAAAKADLTDFDEVVGKSEVDLPNHLYVAVVESEVGPQLAYYLAQNPDEARLLRGMSPTSALRMLGKLEDRLSQKDEPVREDKPAPVTPEKSKAPPPIDPLKDASSPVEKPTEKMTYQEYKAYRQAQRKR
ncbi:capsid scaffolding protein [Xanthomonas phage PBR31]|uniref:Capsid scaffolding protein n=1 Tax=Xanthomonas phage PPDBI TaxID=2723911 RepID=A0A6H0X5N8_9CAUD|nr:hypothetical protein [Ralstonia pickettii]NYS10330.1 hypothetical protein [Ralstonia pickettii]QIN95332.1 capsid scaffolding protein [Xanthomonas phage PBR31]QIW89380.1 capsid scaffolding protein [Xanthomonas phage PPDBI]